MSLSMGVFALFLSENRAISVRAKNPVGGTGE
jgi:hypothetical protein